MGREVIGTISVEPRVRLIAEVFVTPESPLDTLTLANIDP